MSTRNDIVKRSRTLPRRKATPATAAALPILGAHGDRRQLARLSFGKFKLPLTADELAGLSERAERHLRDNGTLFGFVRALLLGGAADVRR